MAFVCFEKERRIMGQSIFGLQIISELLHGRPSLCLGVRNFQLLEKTALADLARYLKRIS